MIIAITSDRSRIEDVDDCTRLHVRAIGIGDAAVGASLLSEGLGRPGEPNHVWLAVEALHGIARTAATVSDWAERFDSMIAYAGSNCWLDATGEHIAAHIERANS